MRSRLLQFAVCLALGTIRCGGSPNASASTASGQVDAGGTGGSADAGSGSDGGVPDAGSGVDAGTAASECDGLGADPSALSIAITAPTEACGFASTSDSSGNLAFSGSSDITTPKNWATYDRGGARVGTLHAFGPVLPRANGFFGVDYWKGTDPQTDYLHLWTFAPDGSGPSQSVGVLLCRAVLQPMSAGGVLVLGNCGAGIRSASRVIWFDDAGSQKWVTFPGAGFSDAAAGDSGGNVLVTAASDFVQGGRTPGDLVGRWIAPDGVLSSDWFVIVSGNTAPSFLQPLIGGGIAVMQNGKWVAVVAALGAPKSPPDWLASRPDHDFRLVRGGKAYAFTSRIVPQGTSGGPYAEVVTPSGHSCGVFDTAGTATTIGADGTVIANTDSCTRRVWPRLLGDR